MARISKSFRFEAAHWLPHVPEDHQCRRLHGHSYEIVVSVEGSIDPVMGWVVDFGDISRVVKPLVAQLDHTVLNETMRNPTAELLAMWFYGHLSELGLSRTVKVRETATSEVEYP